MQKSQYIGEMIRIGEKIKIRRKYLQITQEELADIAGVGVNTLTKIERNEGNPTLIIVDKVLDALGLELDVVIKNSRL